MPATYLSKITLPVNVEGTVSNVEFTLKDAEARQMIEDLGHALYWAGVTTTALTDGATTNPIVINGEDVTADIGAVASYDGLEFVFNGTAWQAFGHANFGALAFKSSASGSYTPAGTINVSRADDDIEHITPFGSAGTLPEAYFTVSGETATFNFSAGTLPTAGPMVDVVTESGRVVADFEGTAATITVE